MAPVPTVERAPWGIVGLILNVLPLPGLGTLVTGVVSRENILRDVVVGILQLLLVPLVVGWLWSIVWGVLIFVQSR